MVLATSREPLRIDAEQNSRSRRSRRPTRSSSSPTGQACRSRFRGGRPDRRDLWAAGRAAPRHRAGRRPGQAVAAADHAGATRTAPADAPSSARDIPDRQRMLRPQSTGATACCLPSSRSCFETGRVRRGMLAGCGRDRVLRRPRCARGARAEEPGASRQDVEGHARFLMLATCASSRMISSRKRTAKPSGEAMRPGCARLPRRPSRSCWVRSRCSGWAVWTGVREHPRRRRSSLAPAIPRCASHRVRAGRLLGRGGQLDEARGGYYRAWRTTTARTTGCARSRFGGCAGGVQQRRCRGGAGTHEQTSRSAVRPAATACTREG